MILSKIRNFLTGPECDVQPPDVTEIEGYLSIRLVQDYPAFIVPGTIALDDAEIWTHEFTEATLWDVFPQYRYMTFGVFAFTILHALTSLTCTSIIGRNRVSPDQFWEKLALFYDIRKPRTLPVTETPALTDEELIDLQTVAIIDD